MRWAPVIVVLAGCSRLFGFEEPVVGDAVAPVPDAGVSSQCSSLASLVERVDRPLAARWSEVAGVQQVAGVIRFDAQLNPNASLTSRAFYQVRDGTSVTVHLTSVETTGQIVVSLNGPGPTSPQIGIAVVLGMLVAFRVEDGAQSVLGSLSRGNDPEVFLRIARSGSMLELSSSVDGVMFQPLATTPADLPIARLGITAENTTFDLVGVNADLAMPDPACPASQLVDDFDTGTTLDPVRWGLVEQTSCASGLVGGTLGFQATNDAITRCTVTSSLAYDLRQGGFVVQPGALLAGRVSMTAQLGDTAFAFAIEAGMLEANLTSGGAVVTVKSLPYDPQGQRFVKLAFASDGVVSFAVSVDGASFDEIAQLGTNEPDSPAQLELSLTGNAAAAATIEGVNAP